MYTSSDEILAHLACSPLCVGGGGRRIGRAEDAFHVHFETGKGESGVHLHAKRLVTLRLSKV